MRIFPAQLAARRVLVVAPHPDDESLGCGGVVASLVERGTAFHFVFVTEGGASHPGSPSWPRDRLVRQREREAEAALDRLGADEAPRDFLRLLDSAMPPLETPEGRGATARLAGIARGFAPDLVLLPWRRDPHCDHRATWALTQAGLRQAGLSPATLEYAIWLEAIGAPEDRPRPGEAERVEVDVATAVLRKRLAVMAHVSQTTDLIDDDPTGFRLSPAMIERCTGPVETYWRAVT